VKYPRINVDMSIVKVDSGGFAIGAEFRFERQTVAIASLIYPEARTKYDCLRRVLPVLLEAADAEFVVFRSGCEHFGNPRRLLGMLRPLANQSGKIIRFRKHRAISDCYYLAIDVINRKENVLEVFET
jgi:hypothetical protein